MNYIGVDIGGTKCAVLLGDEQGNVLKKEKFATTDYPSTLNRIMESIGRMGDCAAIGVSCGGPLDAGRGVIQSPPNLPGWDNVPITRMLTERFFVPAYLCNDADACALAEWKYGAGQGSRNMIFLTFGTGMGAGLILDGKLYRGTRGMAGEVGHLRLAPEGPVGYGKAGSFEGFCSGGGIARLGRQIVSDALTRGERVSFLHTGESPDALTAKVIGDAAEAGDPLALYIYTVSAEKLGEGLSVLIDILNPDCIVIGSIFQRSEKLFRSTMERVICREALVQNRECCRIVPAALGDRIGDIAALTVAVSGSSDPPSAK